MEPQTWQQQLRENVGRVRQNIADAAARSGRDPDDVHLVAVTKYVSPAVLRALVEMGIAEIGESRVQQLTERADEFGDAAFGWPNDDAGPPQSPRWHMIGHLQRNKVRQLLPHCRIIHSLDSTRLADAIEQRAGELDVDVDVLIELNVAGESRKSGIAPAELGPLAEHVGDLHHLRLRGLMTMAPFDPDPEHARPHFARLRDWLDSLRSAGVVEPHCTHLSMGMSQDYPVAIEEGATLVRVGSALFEGLPTNDPR